MLAPVLDDVARFAKEDPKLYKKGAAVSWDNAQWHSAGELLSSARVPVQRLLLPPYSSDMHQVVEHAINAVKAAATKWFNDHPEVQSLDEIKKQFEKLFYTAVKVSGVRKDILSLRETYRITNRSRKLGGGRGRLAAKEIQVRQIKYSCITTALKTPCVGRNCYRSPEYCVGCGGNLPADCGGRTAAF